MIFLFFFILFLSSLPQTSLPCTTFCLDRGDQPLVGKNYDWGVEDGLVIINKRGVIKTAISLNEDFGQLAKWTSKYGSITFNQYGREMPMGGMNETGLVVEMMMLGETQYPAHDSRPSISNLQWIQYQLDNFSTVKEVISSDSKVRIYSGNTGLHYMACDKMGNCASIEFIGGKLVYHINETMPIKVLTNSTYSECIEYYKQGKIPEFDIYRSVERFMKAAAMVKNYDPKGSTSAVDYAFDVLKKVKNPERTKWSIVYDMQNYYVYFRTLTKQKIRYFDLNSFDLSCATPVKVLDINADLSGNVTNNFIDYTQRINRNLIGNAYKKTSFLMFVPDDVIDSRSRYPESTICNY
jgi:choloylglycine hydrolase